MARFGGSRVRVASTTWGKVNTMQRSLLQLGGTCPMQAVTVETDIVVCNNEANEVVDDNPDITAADENTQDDNGTVTSLAMYPKQAFDWAGRTGTVVFDVSDDSGGMHDTWPELWVTNLPVPDPFVHFSSWQAVPQYGFGIRLGAACTPAGTGSGSGGAGCGPNCPTNNTTYVVSVASVITVNNSAVNDSDTGDTGPQNAGTLQVVPDNCVTEPVPGSGQMNHFEVQVSQSTINVWGTNAFIPPYNPATSPLVHLASVPNADLGFTRGLIWLEDEHYNANKGVDTEPQAMHTFTWDNLGFDGPVLPRDFTFDALDSLTSPFFPPATTTETNLGWESSSTSPATLSIPRVTAIDQAKGGLLTFNFLDPDVAPVTLEYALNGNVPHSVSWPFHDDIADSVRTIAVPIALVRGRKRYEHSEDMVPFRRAYPLERRSGYAERRWWGRFDDNDHDYDDRHPLAGANRIATAIAVSQADYPSPGSAGAVIVARDDDFADALGRHAVGRLTPRPDPPK